MINRNFFINHQKNYFNLKKYHVFSIKDYKKINQNNVNINLPYNYSELFIRYNEEYHFKKKKFLDLSFFIYENATLIAFIPLTISKDSDKFNISSQGQDIISPYFFNKDNRLHTFENIYNYYLELMKICKLKQIKIKENFSYNHTNYFNLFLMQKNLNIKITELGLINLSHEITDIKRHFRKSYKSLINKKYENFIIQSVDKNNNLEWNKFKDFHLMIANKKTRPDKTWEIQFEMLNREEAYLFTIKEKNKLIGGTFVNVSNLNSYYSVAVFDRSYFPIPLGHILQFFTIKSLKSKNIKYYILGEFGNNINLTKKEENINNFKKGFCTNLEKINNFTIEL